MGRKQSEESGRDIVETLNVLGIDDDIDPADAARDAADEVASSADAEVVEDGDDIVADDEAAAEASGEPPAVTAQVDVVVPPPKDAPEPEETALPDPAPPVMVPVPKPERPRKPVGGGAKSLPKALTDKAPGAAKVKVHKREEGQRWFIRDYTLDDLATFPDFESFLTRYVKPKHGAGEYDLVGVDAMNREMELGTVRLLDAPEQKENSSAMDLVRAVMDRSEKQNEQYLAQMREMMKPQQASDPLVMLSGVMGVQEKLSAKADAKMKEAESKGGDVASALAASSDKTMQMFLAMMQANQAQQQQQQQMMMAVISKPKEEDPVMKMLLMKMLEEGGTGGGALPAPPSPPPKESTAELITALAGFMAAMGGGGSGEPPDDEFKEFMKAKMLQQDADRLSIKDVIALMNQKEEKPNLKSAIDDLGAVLTVANNLNRNTGGEGSAGLYDALAALFSNRDFAGSIANTIRAKLGQGEAIRRTQLEAERQRLALQQRMTQKTMEMAGGAPQQQQPPPGYPPQQQQPPPGYPGYQQPPQQQGPYAQPVEPAAPQGATPDQVQQAVDNTVARTGKLPQLPDLTAEHINRLANAADEGDLVGKTISMLIYFAEYEDWRGFSEQLLGFLRDGNKRGTAQYLTAFFDGLAQIHLIDPTLAKRVVKALMDHFETVQAQMTDVPLESDGEITGDDLLATDGDDDPTTDHEESPGGDGE